MSETSDTRDGPDGGTAAGEPDPPGTGVEGLAVELTDRVLWVTLDRPEARNALTWEMIEGLRRIFVEVRSDPRVGAVVLRGAGDRAFSAGADLAGMTGGSVLDMHEARGRLPALFEAMWACGRPTVASVRGYCLAGGLGVALACDLVVAADDAMFGTPEVNVGLWPYIITVPLLRSMPPKRALELMMTGRRIDAGEADRFGFLTRVVAPGELTAATAELAGSLASSPAGVIALGRDSFYRVVDSSASDAMAHLQSMLSLGSSLDDATEGTTAFLEKRRPNWSGT
ncbi:MAG: enoyl-CoA hydratase/isomerase family protein [Microthrixaceae bacterium]